MVAHRFCIQYFVACISLPIEIGIWKWIRRKMNRTHLDHEIFQIVPLIYLCIVFRITSNDLIPNNSPPLSTGYGYVVEIWTILNRIYNKKIYVWNNVSKRQYCRIITATYIAVIISNCVYLCIWTLKFCRNELNATPNWLVLVYLWLCFITAVINW